MTNNLTTSDEGISFIKEHEGVVSKIYSDPIGLPTGGVGHLLSEEELLLFPLGTPLTDTQVEAWLREDVKEAENSVNTLVKVPLTQSQFDSLVSFVFNIGETRFRTSTLLRLLNQGKYEEAARQFPSWVYAGGRKLAGLKTRRQEELNLFLKQGEPNESSS